LDSYKREIGLDMHFLNLNARYRRHNHTARKPDEELVAIDHVGSAQRVDHVIHRGLKIIEIGNIGHEQHELVAAETRDNQLLPGQERSRVEIALSNLSPLT
jgi:hypothetical protein